MKKDERFKGWEGTLGILEPCPACKVAIGELHKEDCSMRKALELETHVGEPGYPIITLKECGAWLQKLYKTPGHTAPSSSIPVNIKNSLMMYGFISGTTKN